MSESKQISYGIVGFGGFGAQRRERLKNNMFQIIGGGVFVFQQVHNIIANAPPCWDFVRNSQAFDPLLP
jgi:hypothetical protein